FASQLGLHVGYRQKEATPFALEKVKTLVRGNAINPCKQPGIFTKAVDVTMDFNKNFLRNIVGVDVVDHHYPDMPIHPLLICAYQQIKAVTPGLRITDLF